MTIFRFIFSLTCLRLNQSGIILIHTAASARWEEVAWSFTNRFNGFPNACNKRKGKPLQRISDY